MRLLEKISGAWSAAGSRADGNRRTSDRLRVLLDGSRLVSAPSMEALLDRIAQAARSLFATSHARVHLYDAGRDELWAPSPAGRMRVPAGGGPRAQALRTGHAVRGPSGAGGHVLCAPLRDVDGGVIGVLEIEHVDGAAFDRESLRTAALLAEQGAQAVQRYRLHSAAAEGRALRREVELAQEVQSALLPGRATVPGVEACGWSRPASIAGGDCFDYWRLADGRLALFLGDASGHGVAGALVIAQVRALVRVLSEVRADPGWLLERVNARLHEDLESNRFVTAFVGCLGPDGALEWCSAGQGPLYVRLGASGEFQPFEAQVPPLGVDLEVRPEPGPRLRLAPGGRLALVSDGILEADNGAGQMLGPRRIQTILDNTGELPLEKVVELLRDVLFTWQGRQDAADDQSILVAGLAG